MSNPSKDPKFNNALRRMLDAKPKANEELKKKNQPKPSPKPRAKEPWKVD